MAELTCADNVSVAAHQLDLTDAMSVETWLQQNPVDLCIHTAALSVPRLCELDPERARQINVPVAFFNALAITHARIIALSTDQVYDGDPNIAPYDESSPAEPVNVYGKTKLDMEQYILSQFPPNRAVILRSSIILGPKAPLLPEQAHSTFLHFIQGRKEQDTTFFTDECRSVISVADVVNVLQWFIDPDQHNVETTNHQTPIYNLGGPDRVSRYDMAVAVFDHLGYDKKHIQADRKASQPRQPNEVTSPLDISMNSSKLVRAMAITKFQSLMEVVQFVFPKT